LRLELARPQATPVHPLDTRISHLKRLWPRWHANRSVTRCSVPAASEMI
jgi:hypothetical protein